MSETKEYADNPLRIVEVRPATTYEPQTIIYADGRVVTITYGPRDFPPPIYQGQGATP